MTAEVKRVLADIKRSTIEDLKAAGPSIVHYEHGRVQCPIHGHHSFRYFIAGGVIAQYVCGACWDGLPANSSEVRA